jgi:hypothetical protein
VRQLLSPRQQLQRSQDRQSRPDQRQKLLVEDQEGLQLDLLFAAAGQQVARLHGVDVVARL